MKSVVQALYKMSSALGNLLDLVVISASSRLLTSRTHEFILFACLMLADMAVLAFMARRYNYKEEEGEAAGVDPTASNPGASSDSIENNDGDNGNAGEYHFQINNVRGGGTSTILIAINGPT